jgi:hypothetical protein
MQQKLWHWTADSLGDWAAFFPACHVKLDVTADRVRVVFFDTVTELGADQAVQPLESLDAYLDSHTELPRFRTKSQRKWFSGAYFGESFKDIVISPTGIAIFDRAENSLGNAEMDGVGMYAFPIDASLQPLAPFNAFSQTFLTKREPRKSRLMGESEWPVIMTLPYPDAPFTEANFIVRNRADMAFVSNLEGWDVVADRPEGGGIIGTLPGIKLSQDTITLSAGGAATVEATVIDSDGTPRAEGAHTIYLEETGGFIPMRRVKTANGKATFRVSAMGMQAGDTFKVKAGYRNYSGCAEVTVKVI